MFEGIMERCRRCVRARRYVVTLHAVDEMEADGFSILDLEAGILKGTILEAQRDRETHERKYRVRGSTGSGRPIEQIVKFSFRGTLVIITVYKPLGRV